MALLALVLLAAVAVSRTCGANDQEISQDEAIAIAEEQVDFTPCSEPTCVQIRYIPRGIPVQGFWGVVLADALDADGRPNRVESFLVSVETGEVIRP